MEGLAEAAVGAVAAHPLVHHRQDRHLLALPEDPQGLEAVVAVAVAVARAVREIPGPQGEPTPLTERASSILMQCPAPRLKYDPHMVAAGIMAVVQPHRTGQVVGALLVAFCPSPWLGAPSAQRQSSLAFGCTGPMNTTTTIGTTFAIARMTRRTATPPCLSLAFASSIPHVVAMITETTPSWMGWWAMEATKP